MTTGYAVPPPRNAFVRGWRAFVRWCRGRPFWGGLLTIVSGGIYFYSGHLGFAGIKISFSQQEFLGWMIPLILGLCGLLLLFTPAQRIFYGVLASAVSVGGLVGLNLGGFVIGMLVGIVGGALGASWTPAPQPVVTWPAGTPAGPDPEPGTGAGPDTELVPAPEPGPEPEPEEPSAGHFSGPLADTLPASMVSPLGVPARTTAPAPRSGAVPGAPEPSTPPAVPAPAVHTPGTEATGMQATGTRAPGTQAPPGTRAPGPLRPGIEPPDAGASDDEGGPPPGDDPLPRRSPRGLAVILVLLTVAAVGATTARLQTPAGAAPSCAEVLDSLLASASPAPSARPTAGTAANAAGTAKSTGTGTAAHGRSTTASGSTKAAGSTAGSGGGSTAASGGGRQAPAGTTPVPSSPAAAPAPTAPAGSGGTSLGGAVRGLLDGLGNLLGIGDDDASTPAPSASASPTPSERPTASPRPTVTPKPTGTGPTGTPKAPAPSTHSTSPATHPSGRGNGAGRAAAASPSSTACPVGSTDPVAPLDQTVVAPNPAEQITALLVEVEVTYRGVTTLPTASGGRVRVLQFTMASSSSTPFELRVPMVTGNHTLSYKSTKLTVSGHVTFYTSRLTGNLLGLVPVNWTPDAPPPLPPLPIPGAWFTNAVLELVLVHADKLTAPALDISYQS